MVIRRLSGACEGVSLRCRGCGRTATASSLSAATLADLLGWRRRDDGDWCVLCQWNRGTTPRFVERIARF